jgi:hypothetical protein
MSGIAAASDADYENCRVIVRKLQAAFPLD